MQHDEAAGPSRAPSGLHDRDSIVRALTRLGTDQGPRRSVVLAGGGPHGADRDPFGFGFIAGLEERVELARLLRRLDHRSAELLLLWYAHDWPVARIAERLGISRVHCYRLRDRAFAMLVDGPAGTDGAASPHGEMPSVI